MSDMKHSHQVAHHEDNELGYAETRPKQSLTWYTFNCATFAAVGSLLYGIDSGIISTTISHDSFRNYFAPYTGA